MVTNTAFLHAVWNIAFQKKEISHHTRRYVMRIVVLDQKSNFSWGETTFQMEHGVCMDM